MHLSLLFAKEARPFILHFVLIILSAIVILCFIDPPGAKHHRVYNLIHRQPQFTDLDGWHRVASNRHTKPLQSDITTTLSLLASATRAAAAWWAGKFLWRCAFMFMEKGEIALAGFSKVISGGITTLLPPRHVSNRKNWLLVYTIIFICFMMDYFSAILTGSVTWQPSAVTLVDGIVPLVNLTEGIPGYNISFYRDQQLISQNIQYAATLDLFSWGMFNMNSSNFPIPSNLIRRPVIQGSAQKIQDLPPHSTLGTIRLPYFKVEKFEYITDPNLPLTPQQSSLLNDSSPYNPYSSLNGHFALFPDANWGPDSSLSLPSPVTVSESRILGILYDYATVPRCKPLPHSSGPQNLSHYAISLANGSPYSCFVFANVTYTAGAAICQNCKIISPILVQENITRLQLIPDPLTIEALAILSSVATQINVNLISYPTVNNSTTYQALAIESISRAYHCAWTSLVFFLGAVDQNNQTSVMVAVPASQPIVFRWRVYLWAGLHIAVLLGGIVFVYYRSHFRHPWVADPVTAAFLLDTTGIFERREGVDLDAMDPWHPDARHPAGKLKLNDYDSSRPGHPRTVVLIPTRSITRSGYQQLDSESDIFLTRFR